MQITVFVEPLPGSGFRASGAGPIAASAEGPTRQAALAKLKAELQARLRHGAEIVALEIDSETHPLAKHAGTLPDDDLTKDWEAAMAGLRRQFDEGPEIS